MEGCLPYCTPYGRYRSIWTTGGKTMSNLLEYLTGYLLTFLEPNSLSNSKSYEFLKFTSHNTSKIGQKRYMLPNFPQSCRQGQKYFYADRLHHQVLSPKIFSKYLTDWQNCRYLKLTHLISPWISFPSKLSHHTSSEGQPPMVGFPKCWNMKGQNINARWKLFLWCF